MPVGSRLQVLLALLVCLRATATADCTPADDASSIDGAALEQLWNVDSSGVSLIQRAVQSVGANSSARDDSDQRLPASPFEPEDATWTHMAWLLGEASNTTSGRHAVAIVKNKSQEVYRFLCLAGGLSLLVCFLACALSCSSCQDEITYTPRGIHQEESTSRRWCCLEMRDTPAMFLPAFLFAMPLLLSGVNKYLAGYAALYGSIMSLLLLDVSWILGPQWISFAFLCLVSATTSLPCSWLLHSSDGDILATVNVRLLCVLIYLACLILTSVLLPCLGCTLIGSSEVHCQDQDYASGFNIHAAGLMTYGFDCGRHEYPQRLQQDLIYDRMCWSGEPGPDFVFFLANHHVFLSCLFAHPAHPYAKWERIILLVCVGQLIVFPVVLMNTIIDQPLIRLLTILVAINLPRTLLRGFMHKYIVEAEKEILGKQKSVRTRWKLGAGRASTRSLGDATESVSVIDVVQDARHDLTRFWQAVVYIVTLVVVTGLSAWCWFYLKAHLEYPLWEVLSSLDGLAFAFVLDFPFITLDKSGWPWWPYVGFFYHWSLQRHQWLAKQNEEDIGPRPSTFRVRRSVVERMKFW